MGQGSFNSKLRLEFSRRTSTVAALTAYSIKAAEHIEFPAVATSHFKVCVVAARWWGADRALTSADGMLALCGQWAIHVLATCPRDARVLVVS